MKESEEAKAMLMNLRARVESDPMAVPAPARMDSGREDGFEQVLQQAVAADEPREVVEERPVEDADAKVQEPTAPVSDGAEPPVDEAPMPVDAPTSEVAGTVHFTPCDDDMSAAEPGRQATAGKGTDSPRTSSSPATSTPSAEPLLAVIVQQGGVHARGPLALGGDSKAIGAVGGTRATGEAPARAFGSAGTSARAATAGRSEATAASYRTSGAASAQMLDQARDSVFKQILLQLQPDGGEMRIKLQPPELGELDVRLVVEQGNQLSLAMTAERGDLAELLQRHLDELKQSLQQAGLQVTDASVQTRSEGGADRRQAARRSRDDGAFADATTPSGSKPRFGGRLTATGLDFWA